MQVSRLFAGAVLFSLALGAAAVRGADTYQVDGVHSMYIFKIKHCCTIFFSRSFSSWLTVVSSVIPFSGLTRSRRTFEKQAAK